MLGPVDFTGVTTGRENVYGTFEGQTAGWEAKPAKDGHSTNVLGYYEFTDDDGKPHKRTEYYNLKTDSLWRLKRDLIWLGADPSEFEGVQHDLEGILNRIFNRPGVPCKLTYSKKIEERDGPYKGQESMELTKIETLP